MDFAPDGFYNPHFTEREVRRLIEEKIAEMAPFFIDKVQWNRGPAVFADLSFGETATGKIIPISSANAAPIKVSARVTCDVNGKKTIAQVKVGDKEETEVFPDLIIKKGFIDYKEMEKSDNIIITVEDDSEEDDDNQKRHEELLDILRKRTGNTDTGHNRSKKQETEDNFDETKEKREYLENMAGNFLTVSEREKYLEENGYYNL